MSHSAGVRDVLIVVDAQRDFCPGGALAVPRGDETLPAINRLARDFAHVILTQDWHPPGHASFASAHPGRRPFETIDLDYGPQTLWPDHCVQGTDGAAFHPALDIARAELIIRKGHHLAIDSYSAFRDARETGFDTTVVLAASRGIDLDGSLSRALAAMRQAGVALI
jgi:nicotinamidase/pyrazinamidase